MECAHYSEVPSPLGQPVPVLAAYYDGVAAICQLADQFSATAWNLPTLCPEWRAGDLAGHLHCVADDFNEYLDEAPVSRYARLMATGAHPDTLGRKLARQNAAELAALADAPADEHIAAFAESARSYAARLPAVWELPGVGARHRLPAGRSGDRARRLAAGHAAPAADRPRRLARRARIAQRRPLACCPHGLGTFCGGRTRPGRLGIGPGTAVAPAPGAEGMTGQHAA
jgi:hypothetical protein